MFFARFTVCLLILLAAVGQSDSLAGTRVNVSRSAQMTPASDPIFVIYYWRARPGKAAAYSEYIRTVAEPIDEEARKAGVFESVHTYTPALMTGAPGADWTHMRVFQLKNMAAWEGFGAGLDDAAKRVYPDEAKRKDVMAPAADLRDLVRQEIWKEFK
jgi:hypothetical protein